MFNGIIKNIGKVNKIYKKNDNCIIDISSKFKLNRNEIGSSISCSGACLTVEKYNKNLIRFYVSKETLNRTNFKSIKKGDIINLEKSIRYGERLSGHFVQGHVDVTSVVKKINFVGRTRLINFKLSKKNKNFLVQKGSIAINGVSLTISKILKDGFQIAVIPKTLKLTNLIKLKEKDIVNIEFDIISKYIKSAIK